ncbi:hypothetical protein LTS02_015633 [Friedmanniomyces endolithicus]|nr:hypothetical protein LTS02_015633 [Friedmanniomyces endolithicus]
MTSPEAEFALFEIVSGKMFNRSLQQIKQQRHRDFSRMKCGKGELKDKDFADLVWAGIATQRRAGGQKALPAPPTRRWKAIKYDTRSTESDIDTEDDINFTTPYRDDAPKLLDNKAQLEQQESDALMEVVRDMASKARVPSRKTAKQLGSKAAPDAPPSNDDEAAQMIAALQLYSRGKKNHEKYVLEAQY